MVEDQREPAEIGGEDQLKLVKMEIRAYLAAP